MHIRHFPRLAAGAVALAAVALLPGGPASAADPGATYVALGDSFASGEGAAASTFQADTVGPSSSGTSAGCHRSPTSWAGDVAVHLGLANWRFAACSGAMVEDIYNPNGDSRYPADAPPQLHEVDPESTELVTLSIGGNDVGFSDVLEACVYGGRGANGSSGCRDGAIAGITDQRLDSLSAGLDVPGKGPTSLATLYREVADRVVPGGRVVVTGYPHLFGDDRDDYENGDSCRVGTAYGVIKYRVDYDDAQWINGLTDRGNAIIAAQVDEANRMLQEAGSATVVTYAAVVDPDSGVNAFAGHSLCDKGDSWLNGVQVDSSHRKRKQTSFHPNLAGQRAYAGVVIDAIG